MPKVIESMSVPAAAPPFEMKCTENVVDYLSTHLPISDMHMKAQSSRLFLSSLDVPII